MKNMRVRITFTESILGSSPADTEIYTRFIASKAPEGSRTMEEVESIKDVDKEDAPLPTLTVFGRNQEGKPVIWDYQIRGLFKEAAGGLKKVDGTLSSKCKAFKKQVDNLIFIKERMIPLNFEGKMTYCQRPLRAQTMQGERVSLACSEEIPAGATAEFTVQCFIDSDIEWVKELLTYGSFKGLGQWRNASHGRFTWENLGEEKVGMGA